MNPCVPRCVLASRICSVKATLLERPGLSLSQSRSYVHKLVNNRQIPGSLSDAACLQQVFRFDCWVEFAQSTGQFCVLSSVSVWSCCRSATIALYGSRHE